MYASAFNSQDQGRDIALQGYGIEIGTRCRQLCLEIDALAVDWLADFVKGDMRGNAARAAREIEFIGMSCRSIGSGDAPFQAAMVAKTFSGICARKPIWTRFHRLIAPISTVRLAISTSLNWLCNAA